jgi:hypothetical protein
MRAKVAAFASVYLGGGLLLMVVASSRGMKVFSVAIFGWFLVFGLAQFWLFRCPWCKKLAILTPRRAATPFVGSACRYCGQEY